MVRVDDNYFIEVDAYNYTAKYDRGVKKQKKDGSGESDENSIMIIGYYTTLENAIRGILDHKVRKCMSEGEKSLCVALNELRAIVKEFNDKLDSVREV